MIDFIIDRYKYIIALIILIALPFGHYFMQYRHYYHLNIYFEKNDPDLINYQRFQREYGNDEVAAIAFKQDDVMKKESIALIRTISERLKGLKDVQRIYSITDIELAEGSDDVIRFTKLIPEKEVNDESLLIARTKVLNNKWIRGFLLSSDMKTAAIIFELNTLPGDEKREVVNKIKRFTQEVAGNTKLHYAGIPFLSVELNELSKKDMRRLVPVAGVLIFFIVMIMLNNLFLTFLCFINLIIIFICSIGLFVACGQTFNLVTNILGPILLAIAIANSIHFISHYRDDYIRNGGNYKSAIRSTFHYLLHPILLTSATTAIGFFSFYTSRITPVKVLGIYTSTGVLIALFYTLLFLPCGLMLFNKRIKIINKSKKILKDSKTDNCIISKFLNRLSIFTTSNYKTIGITMIGILLIFIIGITKIKFESNSKNYLQRNNRIRKDIEFVENNIGGMLPFTLLIKAKSNDYNFTHSESLQLVDKIQEVILKDINEFSTSFSVVNYIEEIHKTFNADDNDNKIPESQSDLLDYYEISNSELIDSLISPDYMESRISFQSLWCSNGMANRIHNHISDYLNNTIGDKFTFIITGITSLSIALENKLAETQIKSLLFAIAVISIIMFFICRTFGLTWLLSGHGLCHGGGGIPEAGLPGGGGRAGGSGPV
ncbi:MAG: efflux RND transporter permease subunit, partial [Spirochaetota bacterium]|nr:efflux RND transporter permease subunit [Spirochaetota bacterium]